MLSTTGGMGLSASPEAMVEDGVETRTGGAADLNVLSPHVVPPGEAPRSGPGGRFITSADEVGEVMFSVAFVCLFVCVCVCVCVCVFVGSFVQTITQKVL